MLLLFPYLAEMITRPHIYKIPLLTIFEIYNNPMGSGQS